MHWSWILQRNCPLIATSLQCCFCVFMTSEPNTPSVGLDQSSMSSQQAPGLSNIIIQFHQTLHLLDFLVHQSRMWSQQGPMPLPQNLTWSPQVHHHTKIVPHITAEIYCPWHKPALIDNKNLTKHFTTRVILIEVPNTWENLLCWQCLYPQANLFCLLWPDLRMVVHKELIDFTCYLQVHMWSFVGEMPRNSIEARP